MTMIFGFNILIMLLLAGYMAYRLFTKRRFTGLICLSIELFTITIALFSFAMKVQNGYLAETFYIVLGILLPAGFAAYDYINFINRLKACGVSENLFGTAKTTVYEDIDDNRMNNDDQDLNFNTGEDVFNKLDDIEPNDYKSYYKLGNSCYKMGLKEEAVECFKRVIEIDSSNYKAYFKMALALDEIGQADDAIQAFKNVLKHKPDMLEAYNRLGAVLSAQGKHDEALYAYSKGLEKYPNEYSFYYNMGITLSQTGRFSEAAEAFKKALERKPDEYEICYHLGAALIELGRYDEAAEAYKSGLNNKPTDSELFYNLSVVYSLLRKRDIALDNLRRAIEINSELKSEAKSNKAFDFIKTNTDFKKLVS